MGFVILCVVAEVSVGGFSVTALVQTHCIVGKFGGVLFGGGLKCE